MITEEDEYLNEEEMEEEKIYEDDQEESQAEDEDRETYFMGTQSQARKRFNIYCSRPISETGLIGDNIRITHQTVIDHDQTQEHKAQTKRLLAQTQEHSQMHNKRHNKPPLVVLDADAPTVSKLKQIVETSRRC